MTYQEIQENYNLGDIRPPKKGELFIQVTNHGGIYNVGKCTEDFKNIYARIVTRKEINEFFRISRTG